VVVAITKFIVNPIDGICNW